MDGLHQKSHNARSTRYCNRVVAHKPMTCLVALVAWLAIIASAMSEDRPTEKRNSIFHAKRKSAEKAPQPLSSASSTLKTSTEAPASTIIPTSQSTELLEPSTREEGKGTAGLRRFPHKSSNVQTPLAGPIKDFDLGPNESVTSVDLPAALRLAGWNSPEVLLAQQRVLAVTARQQLAAAQILPNLNIGTNFDSHTGALQQASGRILQVQRSALYVGAGGNAVAAGTVNIPGLQYNMNVGETYFAYLVTRQLSEGSRAAALAVNNNVLLQVATAYCQLVREQGTRAIAVKVRDNAIEIAQITAAFARSGQGLPADAERAETEVGRRDTEILIAESAIIAASARLGQILNLESSIRLQSNENWVIPRSIVPDPIPLPELVAIALYQRPEFAERRAAVHAAMLQLDNARLLLFSPQFIAGFSDGAFGGGSDVTSAANGSPRFGDFGNRTDEDLVLYWSIRNLGLANRALIKVATARLAAIDWERTRQLNNIRAEVAVAYSQMQARAAQLDVRQRAVVSSERGYREDLDRARAGEGRAIEVLDSLRLFAQAQQAYLDTIAGYNQAQYELYVAIGQPPAELLIHTNPSTTLPSPAAEPTISASKTSKSSEIDQVSQSRDDIDSTKESLDSKTETSLEEFQIPPALLALQTLETTPIDLAGAFALIGVQNPEFLAAQQRVLEAIALRQLAAVQLLPTINLGTSMDSHAGPLQQSNGNILTVNRQSLFVGAGASAIAAGSVNIPGVVWNLNVSDTYFNYLISRQVQAQRSANASVVNNDVQLRMATAYLELVRAAGRRSIAWQARTDAAEVARITTIFARAGQGRPADSHRAASEVRGRDGDLIEAEGQTVSASARLAALVGLDTTVRLVPTDRWAVPHSIVPEPIPLRELLTIAALQRPEIAEQRAEFAKALLALDAAKMLPFSPTVFLGFSAGAFGGGSDLATAPVGTSPFASGQERFGNFQSRTDLDAMVYWSLRNLGVGNQAQIAASNSRVRQSQLQQFIVLDRIRAEVAAAYVRVHTRFHQLKTAEEAVRESEVAWHEDLKRIRGNDGLPIEVLDSQRLLARSRFALLDTIINYNIAQFELYQALGQPQSELLIRSTSEIVPIEEVVPAPIGN